MELKLKTKSLSWQFLLKQSVFLILPFLLIFPSLLPISAQPTDCASYGWKSKNCWEQRDKLIGQFKSEINALTNKINKEPKNDEYYYQRGKQYWALVEKGLISENVEFDEKVYSADVEAKAISDFTSAIYLNPKTIYYVSRAEIYIRNWSVKTRDFQYHAGNTNDEILKNIEKLLLNNENFNRAEDDLLTAIKLSPDKNEWGDAHNLLARLRYWRGSYLGDFAGLVAKTPAAEIALADLDFHLEDMRIQFAEKPEGVGYIKKWLVEKASVAMNLGRDEIALKDLAEAEKLLVNDKVEFCKIYSTRAYLFFTQKKYDLAIKDATTAFERGESLCNRGVIEFRGDIYRQRGQLNEAIKDYTTLINLLKTENPYLHREIYWKRGKLYFQVKDYNKTIADLTTLIGIGSICVQDYVWRAKVYRLMGNKEAVLKDEKEILRLSKILNGDVPTSCSYHKEQ